jgi:hypothetical protein
VRGRRSPFLLATTTLPLLRATIQLDEAIGRYKSHLRAKGMRPGDDLDLQRCPLCHHSLGTGCRQ